jgi:DNA-binding beta-propeller fold protein YncE
LELIMKTTHVSSSVVLFTLIGASTTAWLQVARTIPLEVKGRIDHLALDGDRLFVAALGNDSVEVVDLKAGKAVARIDGLNEPQGVAAVPETHRLIVAGGGDGKVRVYDADLKPLGSVDRLEDADNARYDTDGKLAYVGCGDGALAVIDPQAIVKVGEIKLQGHPESFQLDPKSPLIYVNVPAKKHVAVVDRKQRTVIATWPLTDAAANFPMALDAENHRLFVGCRKPAKLIVLDTTTGKTVASLDCCGDADDIFYDAAKKRIYVAGGEGAISVFEQTTADKYASLGKISTAPGARTAMFSADGELYVAVPQRPGQRSEIRVFKRGD